MTQLSPDQVPERWSAIAPAYERAFEGLSAQYGEDALQLLGLRPGERVIDVAAGTGAFGLLAARAGATVLATDFAPGMVARIRERAAAEGLTGLTAEVMDGQALDVPDAAFDASASILGLIFFPDIAKGIAELRRVLRHGGRTAIVCWDDVRRLRLMTLVRDAIARVAPEFRLPDTPPAWARLAGRDAVRDALRAAGFRDVEAVISTRSQRIDSPRDYWEGFSRSVPPLAQLFEQLGPTRTAEAGRVYMEALAADVADGTPTLTVDACIGIGRV